MEETKLKTFRFFMDIDAENLDDAKEELVERAGDMGSFGDLDNTELERINDQLTYEELCKFFKVKEIEFSNIQNHFVEYDAWLCLHCSDDVGNDKKDMIRHLMKHTTEELKKNCDGDDIE